MLLLKVFNYLKVLILSKCCLMNSVKYITVDSTDHQL